jgi:hypothetical protein
MIYLHIGTDKTGSTAIQKLLYWNRSRLQTRGLLYPVSGMMHYDHARLKLALDDGDPAPWASLREEVASYPGFDVAISHEGFYNLSGETLQRLKEWLPCAEVRVILYLRRQDDMIESGMLQQLKTHEVIPDLFEFESGEMPWRANLDYGEIVQRWGEAFGRQNIRLRPYGRGFLPDEQAIYRDFLTCLDRDPALLDDMELPAKDPNPSIDVASAAALVFLNHLGLKSEQHDAVTDILLYYQEREGRSAARKFTLEQRQALLDKYHDSNRKLLDLPEGFLSLDGEMPTPPLQEQEVSSRLTYLYTSRRYLIGCPEWYGEGVFTHLVRSGNIRLIAGFYPLENWGAWMKGEGRSQLVFRVPRTMLGNLELTLTAQYLKGVETRGRVRANGGGTWQSLEPKTQVEIPPAVYEKNLGLVFIEFEHEFPATPIDAGVAKDDRRLMGAGIIQITYKEGPNR